jgi:molybdopterin/thiamine biosynthesis adenylyltransferase
MEMSMQTVMVVGVGALGSHAIQFLRGAARIRAIDFDRVEQKNTLSQFHARNSVGKNKAQALQQAMQFLWGIKIEVVPHKLVQDNAQVVLKGADLVLDCLDNGASREILQKAVRQAGIPCLHGALSAGGMFGRVIWDDLFNIDYESGEGIATCEDGAFLPFIGMVSTYLARSAQVWLETGKQLNFQIYPSAPATRI